VKEGVVPKDSRVRLRSLLFSRFGRHDTWCIKDSRRLCCREHGSTAERHTIECAPRRGVQLWSLAVCNDGSLAAMESYFPHDSRRRWSRSAFTIATENIQVAK
jgi:hypothetical protein